MRGGQQKGQGQQQTHKAGRPRFGLPKRVSQDRPCEFKFGLSPGVPKTPMGSGPALGGDLPGLVEGLNHKVVDVVCLGLLQKAANEPRLVGRGGPCFAHGLAIAGPADFGHQHGLVRKTCLYFADLGQTGLHCRLDGFALPIWQDMQGNEVHMLRHLWLRHPDMPRLCRRDQDLAGLQR